MSIHRQVDNIGDHNLLFNAESQTVPAYVGIEFMAQSVAAWSLHTMRWKNGTTPPIGFLLGSRRYKSLCDEFTQGQTLDIHEQLMEDSGMVKVYRPSRSTKVS